MFTLSQLQPKFVHETSFKGLLFQCPASPSKEDNFRERIIKEKVQNLLKKKQKKIKENVQYPNVDIKK